MPNEFVAADATALAARLEVLVAPLTHMPSDVTDAEIVLVEDVIADLLTSIGADAVVEWEFEPGVVLGRADSRQVLIAAGDSLLAAMFDEEDGEPERAARRREFALAACEAAISGVASPDLMERLGDSDGIQFDLDPDYDRMCDEAGNVELIEAAVVRPARQRDSRARVIRLWPRLVSTPRRSRPRERRSSSRRSSRAGPTRQDDDDPHDVAALGGRR